jgi:tRNA pseudouridine38-40 synthase
MVRIMVGTLLRIQQGKIPVDGISEIIEKKNRKFAGPTAQACGLYLNKVNYDFDNIKFTKGVNKIV